MTIGVPLPTYSVVILDPDDPHRALPHGEIGEIGIAGIGLARGYVNRDDLTEKAFIPDFLGLAGQPVGAHLPHRRPGPDQRATARSSTTAGSTSRSRSAATGSS